MGGHYGSVQVRTEQRERVKQAAEAVAREQKIKCLVGPALSGWVGIYPENNGQDEKIGAAIAERLADEHVMHVLVHDDDVLAYWVWRGGRLVDSYWSAPGYFGEEDRAEQEQMAGKPEVLASISGAKEDALGELLRRDVKEFTFEVERLERFGKLMRIANLVAAYEYLKDGEREGIKGWRQFEEIPSDDLTREKQAAREEAQRIKAARKALMREGVLLADQQSKVGMPRACGAGDGLLVCWPGYLEHPFKSRLELYRAPWSTAEELDLHGLWPSEFSPDGPRRRLAATTPERGIAILDVDGWKRVAGWSEPEGVAALCLSSDGALAAHLSAGEAGRVVVSDVASGRTLHAFEAPRADLRSLTFHPSNRWVIAAGNVLLGWEVGAGQGRLTRYIGGVNRLAETMQRVAQAKMANVDSNALREQFRQSMKKTLAQFANLKGPGGIAVTPEQLEKMREQVAKQEQDMVDRITQAKSGGFVPQRQGNELVFVLGFSGERGRLMWCGTSAGLRVYDWDSVVDAKADDMPEPLFRFDPRPGGTSDDVVVERGGYIYAAAEEPGGDGLVFGGIAGKVYRMDLKSGNVREILLPPEPGRILQVVISSDGRALGIAVESHWSPKRSSRHQQTWRWQIWSYDALLAGTGG